MKKKYYSYKGHARGVILTAVLVLGALALLYGFIWNITSAQGGTDIFLTCVSGVFTVTLCLAAVFSVKDLRYCVFTDENGIGTARGKKVLSYLRKEEIREAGEGTALTPRGMKKQLYFSTRALTEQEKQSLDVVKEGIVTFPPLSPRDTEEIKVFAPQ